MHPKFRRAVLIWVLLTALFLIIIFNAITLAPYAPQPPRAENQPPAPIGDEPLIALYQLEAEAHQNGWTPTHHQMAGDLLMALGDTRAALAHWLAAELPDSAHQRRIAQASITLGNWPQAQTALSHILAETPNDTWAHYHLGLIRAALQPQQALEHLRIAASDPAYRTTATQLTAAIIDTQIPDEISFKVGTVFIELGLWPYAELAMRHSATLHYPDPLSLAYVGLARDQQEKDGAIWIAQAVALAPDWAEVRYLQGLHLRARGQWQASLGAFDLAVNIEPENPAYYAELGVAYQLLNDLPRAEFWLKEAVRASGNRLAFQRLLADFYAQAAPELGLDPISQLLEPSSALPNGDAEIQASYGWALHLTGDSAAGLAEIEAALAIDPNNPKIRYDKARILLETDAQDQAIPILQTLAAESSPYAEQARDLLDGLLDDGG